MEVENTGHNVNETTQPCQYFAFATPVGGVGWITNSSLPLCEISEKTSPVRYTADGKGIFLFKVDNENDLMRILVIGKWIVHLGC